MHNGTIRAKKSLAYGPDFAKNPFLYLKLSGSFRFLTIRCFSLLLLESAKKHMRVINCVNPGYQTFTPAPKHIALQLSFREAFGKLPGSFPIKTHFLRNLTYNLAIFWHGSYLYASIRVYSMRNMPVRFPNSRPLFWSQVRLGVTYMYLVRMIY